MLQALATKKHHIDKLYLRGMAVARILSLDTRITAKGAEALKDSLQRGDLSFVELGLTNNPIGTEGLNNILEGVMRSKVHLQKLWLFGRRSKSC